MTYSDKKILDVTCGSRTIWFNKSHRYALYADVRQEHYEDLKGYEGRIIDVSPDVIADFTSLPFNDESFHLVVFDPPHLEKLGTNSIMAKRYGKLFPGWETDIRAGVNECMRVLKPNGVLVFKWNERDISTKAILEIIDYEPLFGHPSGSNSQTIWMTFMK